MQDPFNEAKDELALGLNEAESLLDSYTRISKTAREHTDSEELASARTELQDAIESLESDLQELRLSVQAVEQGTRRFSISASELADRKQSISSIAQRIQHLKRAFDNVSHKTRFDFNDTTYPPHNAYPEPEVGSDNPYEAYEQQQQQQLFAQQDTTLTSISSVMGILKEQASVIGREVVEQVGMIGEMNQQVDRTQASLTRAQNKMQQFYESNKSSKSSWCILLLIVVLIIMLLVLLFF